LTHEHGHFEHLLHSADAFGAGTLIAIIWFSFVMSWHCGVMCGPLVCARYAATGKSRAGVLADSFLYNLGRVLSYSALGFCAAGLAGWFSAFAAKWVASAGVILTVVFASLLLIQGLLLMSGREWSWIPRGVADVLNRVVARSVISKKSMGSGFALGVMTAVLPCMTLASALAAAIATADATSGALVMGAFAVGSVPAMMLVPLLASDLSTLINTWLTPKVLRACGGFLLVVAAVLTILRMAS
jgi:sulfite exporter TauE/SafE